MKKYYNSLREYLADFPSLQGCGLENVVDINSPCIILQVDCEYDKSPRYWCAYLCYYLNPNNYPRTVDLHIKINDFDDFYMWKPVKTFQEINKTFKDICRILPASPKKLKEIGFDYE